jgi:glycosyltransferase involved in cell wall biosynthesis
MNRIEVKSNFAWETPRREGPGRYFLYLGRLSSEKGVATLLAAWRRSSSRLLLVGDGPMAERSGQTLRRTWSSGRRSHPRNVPDLIREARAVLLPRSASRHSLA